MPKKQTLYRANRSKKTGLPPGSIVFTGQKNNEAASMSLFSYNETTHEEFNNASIAEIKKIINNEGKKQWININGLHDTSLIEQVGNLYNLHPLLLEDIVNPNQRPKVDEYDNCMYIVARMIYWDEQFNDLQTEQISFVLHAGGLITFQEKQRDIFDYVKNRIRTGKGRVRKTGTDYLLYALLDNLVDNYFLILEKLGDTMETLEEELFNNPKEKTLKTIHHLKREMIILKKSVWPMRDVINNLYRNENELINQSTHLYIKDLYDHILQINENIDIYRDMLTSNQEMYMSSISNKMNLVMKVLTIISTIFIPLTFIVGIYGMNFKFMPELSWEYGYPGVWIIMIIISLGMLFYFRNKRWL